MPWRAKRRTGFVAFPVAAAIANANVATDDAVAGNANNAAAITDTAPDAIVDADVTDTAPAPAADAVAPVPDAATVADADTAMGHRPIHDQLRTIGWAETSTRAAR